MTLEERMQAAEAQFNQEQAGRLGQSAMAPPPAPGASPAINAKQTMSDAENAALRLQFMPNQYLADKAGAGMIKGAGNMVDSAINAGRGVYGWATGQDMPDVSPASNALRPMIPDTAGRDAIAAGSGMGKVGDAAEFVGEMTPGVVAGGAAVSGLAKGMAAARPVASSASKMGQYFDRAREMLANAAPAMRNFGGGNAPPLPGMGAIPNALARPVIGGIAGGTAAAVADADNPAGIGLGAAGGAVIGPGMQLAARGATELKDAVSRGFGEKRVPLLVSELLQMEAGPQAGAIANRLQTAQPVVPQLPAQMANDPSMARVHQFLKGHGTYGTETGRFIDNQATGIAAKVGSLSDDLPNAVGAYNTAVSGPAAQLARDTTPVSNKVPYNYLKRTLVDEGKMGTDVGRAVIREAKYLGAPRRVDKTTPANTAFERVKDMNEKLRPGFVSKGGQPLSDRSAAAIRGFKDAVQSSLRRVNPQKGNTKALFDAYEAAIKSTAPKMNELRVLREIYDDSIEATTTNGARTFSPSAFGAKLDSLKPKVREQLSPASQSLLEKIRNELSENVSGLQGAGGTGAVADNLTEAVLPRSMRALARAPRGTAGGAIRSGMDIVTGKQQRRVIDALSELMKDPAQANTIANLLRQVQAAPTTGNFGRNPALIFSGTQGEPYQMLYGRN